MAEMMRPVRESTTPNPEKVRGPPDPNAMEAGNHKQKNAEGTCVRLSTRKRRRATRDTTRKAQGTSGSMVIADELGSTLRRNGCLALVITAIGS
jgi:hypothetical protein